MANKKSNTTNGSENPKSLVETEGLVSISQAAQILDVSIDTVRRWDKNGTLKSTRPDGKNRYFSVKDLEALKFAEPLSISEASEQLNVSPSTLRRLEKKGLVTPDRNEAGERVYDRQALEKFLRGEYFMRQKEVEEEILKPLNGNGKDEELNGKEKKTNGHDPATHAVLGDHQEKLNKLTQFRRYALLAVGAVAASFLVIVTVITVLFFLFPEGTSKRLGYFKRLPNSKYFSFQAPDSLLARQLRPFSKTALRVVEAINPDLRRRVAPFDPIEDVNDVFVPDAEGNVKSIYSFTFPDTSYIKIPDQGLVVNLNADFVDGRQPGCEKGDLAIIGECAGVGSTVITAVPGSGGGTTVVNTTTTDGGGSGDITEVIAGSGLSGGGSDGSVTLNVGAGNGVSVTGDEVGLKLNSTGSGLQVDSNGLSLNRSCANNEILKWNGTGWNCSTDSSGDIAIEENDSSVSVAVNVLDFLGADFNVSQSPVGEANIALDYTNSGITRRAQNETISGVWTFSSATPLTFTAASTTLTVANASTLFISDGTNNLLSLTDAGTSGNLTVSGDVTINGADLAFNGYSFFSSDVTGEFFFGRDTVGDIVLTAEDTDSTAALTVRPGGAAGLTLGGVSSTSITLLTDGTGDAEVTLPNGSIGTLEILDNSILEADLKVVNAPTDEQCLTYEATVGDFEWQACGAGGGSTDLQGAYDLGNAITTTTNRDIDFVLADTSVDSNFEIAIANGSTSTVQIARQDGASATFPDQLLLLENRDTDGTLVSGLKIRSSGGSISNAIDLSDGEIVNALLLGSNAVAGTNATVNIIDSVTLAQTFGVNATGTVTIGAGQSFTGIDAVTLASGGGAALTLNSASNTIILDATDTTINATGLTTFNTGAGYTINGSSYVRVGDTATPGSANGDDDLFVEGDLEVNGTLFLDGTTVSAASVTAFDCTDCLDFDDFKDAMTLDAPTSATGTTTTNADYLSFVLTNNGGVAGTDRLMVFENALSTNAAGDLNTEAILLLNQADTTATGNTAVDNALHITNTGGSTLTNAVKIGDGSQAITTAINIGSTGVITDLSLQNGETIDNNTDGTINLTVDASGSVLVSTGNLKVGNGSPGVALNGEDAYIEGTLEVDGAVQFDGSFTANGLVINNSTSTFNSDVDFVFAGSENFTISNTTLNSAVNVGALSATLTGDVTANLLDLTITNNNAASTGTNYGLSIVNANNGANTGVIDALAFLSNDQQTETLADGLIIQQNGTGGTLTNGLRIDSVAGTITNGLNVANSSGALTNAITIGSGSQAITTALNIASTGVTTDIRLQNGETIDNNTDGTVLVTADVLQTSHNALIGNGAGNDYLEFSEEGSNPTCSAGLYSIWANSVDGRLKKCQNGALSDLDAAGAWSALTGPTGDLMLDHQEFSTTFTWNTPATAAAKDYWVFAAANDAAVDTNTQRLVVFQNNDDGGSTGILENLLTLHQADTNEALADALIISSAGGAITDAIDLTDSDIVNALNIADNTISGSTAVVDFTNFDVAGDGSFTFNNNSATSSILNLASTGDLLIRDSGTAFATFSDTGVITFAPTAGSDFIVNQAAGTNTQITATAAPTVDMVAISNSGQGVTSTSGVDGLAIAYVQATDLGNITGSAIDIATTASGDSGDTIRAINIGNATNNSSQETAIQIGSNWDTAIAVGITPSSTSRTVDISGNWGGNNQSHSEVSAGTTTVSTKALVYHFTFAINPGATDQTRTFNITGLPETNGTFAFIYSSAEETVTGVGNVTTRVQVNGTQVSEVIDDTAVDGVKVETYTLVRSNGSWRIIGTEGADATADLAEWTPFVGEKPQPGEVVSIAPGESTRVQKSTGRYDKNAIGIVSTAPHTVMGPRTPDSIQLALAGRVPVKVSTENGPIEPGDYLTASSIPGVAMKAVDAGVTIGKAYEAYNSEGVGQIMAFVNTSWYGGKVMEWFSSGVFSQTATGDLAVNIGENGQMNMQNSAGETLLSIDDEGNAAFKGEVTADGLNIKDESGKEAASIDSAGNAQFNGSVNSESVNADQVVASEIGQSYATNDSSISNGDVVMLDPSAAGKVKKADVPYSRTLIGVATSAPGILVGNDEGGVIVAAAGRVSVKVSTENGAIEAGDALTSSSTAGVAMKATKAGAPIIGRATMGYSGEGIGSIVALVDNGFSTGDIGAVADAVDSLNGRVGELEQQVQGISTTNEQNTPATGVQSANGEPIDLSDLTVEKLTVNLDLLVNGGLTVAGPAEFKSTAIFDELVTFGDSILVKGSATFAGDTNFRGDVSFNNNTAGYAVIRPGEQFIPVVFKQSFASAPVISLTLGDGKFANYSYRNVTPTGFEIVLQTPATEELKFSWVALHINDVTTYIRQ